MSSTAFIPLRSGSKRILNKNIVSVAGQPLAYWAIAAAYNATSIDDVVIAVDKPFVHTISELIDMVTPYDRNSIDNIVIYRRSDTSARDGAYTEDVMLEWISLTYDAPERNTDRFMLIQATNPFLTSKDIDSAFEAYETGSASSMISCTEVDRFLWKSKGDGSVEAANYNHYERRRTQDINGWGGYFMENGAFYLSQIQHIWRAKNRLAGRIEPYIMPTYTSQEIDTEADLRIVEQLFEEYNIHGGQ